MKKVENTRSHSWWWDSHISPKNSKWLQENLLEMDSKVSAMLRIIEEDADSFAQRAEMFYKKRPELINLVEEFYRTYRALVERYTYLTREIRQNIAPALQAQLGVFSESSQNSPVDLHSKRGIDGPDIISPSYSYAGASEFDYDSPTAVSIKGQTDDESSPQRFQTNYERLVFGFKPSFPNLEESSPKSSESGMVHGTVNIDASQLQKDLLRLQEENKELSMKASEDVTKLQNFQLQLSSLQSRFRSLEGEDKLTKKRLKSVQEKEQKLEAENLKLSHALISSKEERTELLEKQKQLTEDIRVAYQKNELIEIEREDLRAELFAAQSRHLESSANLKKSEEVAQKLELALTTLKEERLKDSFLMEIYEQQTQDSLKRISDVEKKNAGLTEQASVQVAEVQKLQEQLATVLENTSILEQALHATTDEKACMEDEKDVALSQVRHLQEKQEEAKKETEQQAAEIARLTENFRKLEDEGLRVLSEKLESAKYVHKLEASLEDGQRFKETLLASCQQYEDRCKALELKNAELNEKLSGSSQEVSRLQHQVQTLEDMFTSSQLQCKESHEKVSSLVFEKMSLLGELQNALAKFKVAEGQCAEMDQKTMSQKEEIGGLQLELVKQLDETRRLEEELLHAAKEKASLVEKNTQALMAYRQLENEHTQLKQELELKLAHMEDINHQLFCIELEKSELVLQNQNMNQNILELQTANAVLSGNCLTSSEGLQAAKEEARKSQEKLASVLSEMEKLKEENHAKGELLEKLMSDFERLESRLATYAEENTLLSEAANKCSKNLAAVDAENDALKSRLSDVVTCNMTLVEQVSAKERSIEQSMHKLSDAKLQVVALNEEIASKTSQTMVLQQQISSLEKQVERLCAEHLESSLVKQSLEGVVEELQLENSESKVANKALADEHQKLSSDILTLKSFNQDLLANLNQVKRERESLREDAISLTYQCNDLKHTITSLETDCRAAQSERATLRGQLAESQKEIMISSKKLFKAEGRVQDLQLKLSNMLAEEASLAEQLAERIGKNHILETALLDLQKDNEALSEDVGLLQQEISVLRTREASLLEEMHESSELNQRLTAERERLQQVVLHAEETERRLSLERRKSLEECLLLQQKIENLQQDFQLCCEEKALSLKDAANHFKRFNELEYQVKRLEADNVYLQQELLKAQQVEHKLKKDLENLMEERQQLSVTLDTQKKNIEDQEEDLQSLQRVISSTKEEQHILMDKLNLLAEEKATVLLELKKNKQESERTRKSFQKLQTDVSHLQQVTTTNEAELGNTLKELRVLQETTLSLQVAKSELEQKLESCSRQALLQEDKEKRVLEMHLVDAQKRMIEINEESDRHKKDLETLKQELATIVMAKKELERELVELQEVKTTCYQRLDKMRQEVKSLQEHKTESNLNLEAAILQGQESANKLSNLQEQLLSARNFELEMAEKHSKLIGEWVAIEKRLQEELLQLRSASFQQKNELEFQCNRVLELEDEVCQLQAVKKTLQSDKLLSKNHILDLQQQLGDWKNQLSVKQVESSNLSAEPLLTEENANLELQGQVQLFMEESKRLVQKLPSTDKSKVQIEVDFDTLESRLHELKERDYKLQSQSKLEELTCHAPSEESALFKEQLIELTVALSNAQAQNALLESKFPSELAASVTLKHDLSVLQEEKVEVLAKSFMHEVQAADLPEILMKVEHEFETGKKWADNATVEAIFLQRDWQDAHLLVQALNKNDQPELSACVDCMTDSELLQQELATVGLENTEVTRMVSDEALVVKKLQHEVSNLRKGRQSLERAFHLLKGQLEEAEKERKELLCSLRDCSKEFLQIILKIEDLGKMLSDNLGGERDHAMLEESSTGSQMEQLDLLQTVSSPESGLAEGFAAGRIITDPLPFPEHGLESCILQIDGRLPNDAMRMIKDSSSRSWAFNHDKQRLSDAIDRIKENIVFLLNESHEAGVLTFRNKQQEQVSKLQEESEHLNLEVNLYKKEMFYLKHILNGEDLQAEGEVAHEDVRVLLVMFHNLQDNLVSLEEKVRELQEELRRELLQRSSLELMLKEVEVKGQSYVLLLKKNLLLSCKRLKELASEWNERACDYENKQFSNSLQKLSKAEALCNSSESHDETSSGCIGEGTCRQPEVSQPTGACTLLLGQLQRRVEEFILFSEAVIDLLPPIHCRDRHKDGNKGGACGTSRESEDNPLMDKNNDSHQQFEVSREHTSSDIEFNVEIADSVGPITEDGESEIVETVALDAEKQIELIKGLSQLRINLGMRLHQALMDERLENELQELKEEREKLKDELQARVEQVQRMEAELEKLQVVLKKAHAENGVLDPRQGQQWVRCKKQAEKRARKLSNELVLQRQHVVKMQDTVAAWAKQQELATEILEKQVLLLVSKECAPTMDGWDANQVTQLMQEMQSRKAMARRHSMDLQSVEEDLQRVESSIESTQRQFFEVEGKQQAGQNRIGRTSISVNSASGSSVKDHQKLSRLGPSRFGFGWLMLLFSTRGRYLSERSPKDTISATVARPKQVQRQTRLNIALSSFVAQTRKMRCCGCAPSSDRPKSLDGKDLDFLY